MPFGSVLRTLLTGLTGGSLLLRTVITGLTPVSNPESNQLPSSCLLKRSSMHKGAELPCSRLPTGFKNHGNRLPRAGELALPGHSIDLSSVSALITSCDEAVALTTCKAGVCSLPGTLRLSPFPRWGGPRSRMADKLSRVGQRFLSAPHRPTRTHG